MAETAEQFLWGDLPSSRYLREQVRVVQFVIQKEGKDSEFFELSLMPETYLVEEPQRVSVTQTRGGAYVENFGRGIGTLSFSGTTGFRVQSNPNRTGGGLANVPHVDGYLRWVGLRDFIRKFLDYKETDTTDAYALHFLNLLQEDWYAVYPQGLPRLSRSVQQPLLFRYDLTLTLLKRVNVDGYEAARQQGDDLAEISTRTQRAGAIADRMNALNAQMYLIQQTKDDPELINALIQAGTLAPLTDAQVDAAVDDFNRTLLARQAPPGHPLSTDPGLGVAARTRELAGKVRDYADGSTAFIDSTLHFAAEVVDGWRQVLDAADYTLGLPGAYARYAKESMCAAQSLLLYPQIFRTTVAGTLQDIAALLSDSGCSTTLRL